MTDKDNLITNRENPIDIVLSDAKKAVKQARAEKIGTLLDQASDVLSAVLSTKEESKESARMRAAELAINLYTSQESAERADRQLEVQAKRLEIEEKKIGMNTLLLQQNNIYQQTTEAPKDLVRTEEGSIVDIELLARKKAMQMLLDSQLSGDKISELEEEPEE